MIWIALGIVICLSPLLILSTSGNGNDRPKWVFRVDRRHPDTIFRDGFDSYGDNSDVVEHVSGDSLGCSGTNYTSAFIATSSSWEWAERTAAMFARQRANTGVWLYRIRATDTFYNAEESLQAIGTERAEQLRLQYQHQEEWMAHRRIEPSQIFNATRYILMTTRDLPGVVLYDGNVVAGETVQNDERFVDADTQTNANPWPAVRTTCGGEGSSIFCCVPVPRAMCLPCYVLTLVCARNRVYPDGTRRRRTRRRRRRRLGEVKLDLTHHTTAQSSTHGDASASRAVDGNTSPNWLDGSCTHTSVDSTNNPWWYVDVGSEEMIMKVKIWNRQDCCADRLSNFKIFVTNKAPSSDFVATGSKICYHHANSLHSSSQEFTCGRPMVGRFVGVQLVGNGILTLCEVQVFIEEPIDLLGHATVQSSTVYGGLSSRAVDGDKSQWWTSNSCTHTSSSNRPWWFVDLGADVNHVVDGVKIWNREDCCQDRLTNFQIFVTDRPVDEVVDFVPRDDEICFEYSSTETFSVKTFGCSFAMTGRFVGVQKTGHGILTLCEVQVLSRKNGVPVDEIASVAAPASASCPMQLWVDNSTRTAKVWDVATEKIVSKFAPWIHELTMTQTASFHYHLIKGPRHCHLVLLAAGFTISCEAGYGYSEFKFIFEGIAHENAVAKYWFKIDRFLRVEDMHTFQARDISVSFVDANGQTAESTLERLGIEIRVVLALHPDAGQVRWGSTMEVAPVFPVPRKVW